MTGQHTPTRCCASELQAAAPLGTARAVGVAKCVPLAEGVHLVLAGYVARRLLGAIPVLLGVSVVVFLCMQLIPGDIAKALLGPLATQESVAEFRHYLGLDQPIPVQYVNWLSRAVQGDLGRSFSSNMQVSDLLQDRMRNSAILLVG